MRNQVIGVGGGVVVAGDAHEDGDMEHVGDAVEGEDEHNDVKDDTLHHVAAAAAAAAVVVVENQENT